MERRQEEASRRDRRLRPREEEREGERKRREKERERGERTRPDEPNRQKSARAPIRLRHQSGSGRAELGLVEVVQANVGGRGGCPAMPIEGGTRNWLGGSPSMLRLVD